MRVRRRVVVGLACLTLGLGTSCGSEPEAVVTLSVEPSPILVRTFNFGHGNVDWLASYAVTVREAAGVAATLTAARARATDRAGVDQTTSVSIVLDEAAPGQAVRGLPARLGAAGGVVLDVQHYFGRALPGVDPPPYPLQFEISVDVTDAHGHASTVRVFAGDARTGP